VENKRASYQFKEKEKKGGGGALLSGPGITELPGTGKKGKMTGARKIPFLPSPPEKILEGEKRPHHLYPSSIGGRRSDPSFFHRLPAFQRKKQGWGEGNQTGHVPRRAVRGRMPRLESHYIFKKGENSKNKEVKRMESLNNVGGFSLQHIPPEGEGPSLIQSHPQRRSPKRPQTSGGGRSRRKRLFPEREEKNQLIGGAERGGWGRKRNRSS